MSEYKRSDPSGFLFAMLGIAFLVALLVAPSCNRKHAAKKARCKAKAVCTAPMVASLVNEGSAYEFCGCVLP